MKNELNNIKYRIIYIKNNKSQIIYQINELCIYISFIN